MFGQIPLKISTFATDPDPDHVAKSTPVCKINLPLLLVNHLDLPYILSAIFNLPLLLHSQSPRSFLPPPLQHEPCQRGRNERGKHFLHHDCD